MIETLRDDNGESNGDSVDGDSEYDMYNPARVRDEDVIQTGNNTDQCVSAIFIKLIKMNKPENLIHHRAAHGAKR